MDAALTALLTAGVRVGLAGFVGYLLYRAINVTYPRSPSDWGRKWLSWSLLLSSISLLPSFFHDLHANSFAVWVLVSVILGTVVFLIGWLYGKYHALRFQRDNDIRPHVTFPTKSVDGANDSGAKSITRSTTDAVSLTPVNISAANLAVNQKDATNSPRASGDGEEVKPPENQATGLVILGLLIWWKTSQTNFEYAIAYSLAYYFAGFCIAGVAWIFIRTKLHSWTITDWINYAAYAMVGVLVLSFIVRIGIENSLEFEAKRGNTGVEHTPTAPSILQTSPRSRPARTEPFQQEEDQTGDSISPHLTAAQLERIQTLLTQLGYAPGPIDGDVGPRTRQAITAFQTYQGLAGTGEPSHQLLSHLEYRVSRVIADDVENSDCILKPVMTDADYRACGANPPSRY